MEDMTVAAVAARLRVTPLTVRLWLNAGSLAGRQCGDRANCRISERDLATFLDSKTRGIEQLPPRYRRRYMDRVNELISRMKRELEEYQRVLESDARATTHRRKRN